MRKRTWKKGLAAMLGLILGMQAPLGTALPSHRAFAYTARSASVNASSLNVRSGPGTGHASVAKLAKGTAVTVTNETTGTDGRLWYQIKFTGNGGASASGYVLSTYIKFPVSYSHDMNFETYLNAQGFPDSYKDALRQLHAQYPNWVFTAQHTGLDWNTVIQNEGVLGRNLVHTSSISSYKSLVDGAYNWDNGTWTGFDGSTWVAASEDILRYYMDPRNFLDSASVFQFLSQEYDPNVHTRDGLQSMLNGTFMSGGLKVYGGGTSTGSGSSGGNSGNSGGPGVSGGSTGSRSSGVVTAGQSGRSGAANPSGNDAGGSGNAPGASPVSPQASISPHKTYRVGTVTMIPSGPPISSGGGQNNATQNGAPGGGAVTAPGGTPSGKPNNPNNGNGNPGGGAVITPGGSQNPSGGGSGVVTPGNPPAGNPGNTQSSKTYVDVIMDAAAKTGVNPYVIAAMILQEQGRDGRGNSISGNYGGYTGYYNYFNVGAYASDGMGAVVRGLWYASQSGSYGRPWNSVESSIIGGAQFYGTNYVKAGQDTLYLKKYNVQGSNMYKHQYMTNVDGAAAEGSIFAEGFSASLKNTALQFKIPVYKNMPGTPCAKPTVSGSPNNKLRGLGADGFALTPTFNKDTTSYDLIVDHSVSNVTIYANAIDSKAKIQGAGNIQLHSGTNEIPITVRAENGTERRYVIHIVRRAGGPTYNAGIGGGSQNPGTSVTPGGTPNAGPGAAGPGMSAPGAPNGGGSPVVTPGGNNVTIISPIG